MMIVGELRSIQSFQSELLKWLDYNPETGIVVWKLGKRKGKVAGTKHHTGYLVIKFQGITYELHRLIWIMLYGRYPNELVDHENHVRSDNRKSNLRELTYSKNQLHRKAVKLPKSGRPGIRLNSNGTYTVFPLGSRKRKSLGNFDRLEDAIKCQDRAGKS